MTDQQEGVWLENVECFDCGSKDNLGIYQKPDDTYDAFCRTPKCGEDQGHKPYKSHNRLAASYLGAELGISKITSKTTSSAAKRSNKVEETRVISRNKKAKEKKVAITREELEGVFAKSSKSGGGWRKIKDKYNEFLGIRTTFDDDGAAKYRWYPSTRGLSKSGNPKLVSYKQRICATKKFYHTGDTSWENDLFNQANCKGSGKYLLLVGGEEDVAASLHMIEEYRAKRLREKGIDIVPVDIVSSIIGEGTVAKQCQKEYDFLDGYDNIIVAMDMDTAGDTAVEDLLKVLPPQKVKIMKQPHGCKDPCDALVGGKEVEWIRAFYDSEKPKLAGITGSSELLEDMFSNTSFEKLPLPAFMEEINEMLEGGYDFGTFNIIAGDTSVGKTTDVNEIATCIIEQGDYKPLILSLEAKKSVLAKQYLSLKLGQRLGKFKSENELRDYIGKHQEEVDTFLYKDGENTFEVIDDRARLTSVDDTFDMIERAIRSLGCRVIIIDPASDLTDSLTVEQQASFNSRIKALIATHNVLVIGIYHTRKLDGLTKDGKRRIEPTRYDIYGSKTTINSATTIMLIWRDAGAEDEEERNTTYVSLDKNRDHAVTGRAGEWMYVKEKHRMMNKKRWLMANTEDY